MDDATPIPSCVIENIADASAIRAMIHDADTKPINASGKHRHPTTRQKRVVKERDRAGVDCGSTQLLNHDHNSDLRSAGERSSTNSNSAAPPATGNATATESPPYPSHDPSCRKPP